MAVRRPLALVALALLPLLAACRPGAGPSPAEVELERPLRTTLYLGIGIDRDITIDTELQRTVRGRIGAIQDTFQAIHPDVEIEVLIFPEDRIVPEIRRRTRSGLAPDLLLIDGRTALQLHQQGLTRPVPDPDMVTTQIQPTLIQRVHVGRGELIGIPQALTPQLACFDRRAMGNRSPTTLAELLQASSRGRRIGISTDFLNLAWTLGALGALDSFASALEGKPATAAERSAIAGWLLWLRTADLQQRISLVRSQEELDEGLEAGELDWITCRSTTIRRLRESLGERLGLAPLPSGPSGPPSPISRMRVLAFGRHSSGMQARTAEALAAFGTNPQMQRALMLRSRELLPVNRNVPVPVAISADLAALVAAQEQGSRSGRIAVLTRPREMLEPGLSRILLRFLYGELDVVEASDALLEELARHAER